MPAPRSAVTSASTIPGGPIRALTGRPQTKPTSPGFRTTRQPEQDRRSTYQTRNAVQTNRATSLFVAHPEVRNGVCRIASGADTRGTGGYVIAWHATGLPVLCAAPLAPWPAWLVDALQPPPAVSLRPPVAVRADIGSGDGRRYAVGALRHAVERVAAASEGQRNDTLNAECFAMGRFVAAGTLAPAEVADALAIAARHAGLAPAETAATLASALRAGAAR